MKIQEKQEYVKYCFRRCRKLLYYNENGVWVKLPAPDTITLNNEIIWSSNTGRSATGKMIGDVIAEKNTLTVNWGGLRRENEYKKIKYALTAGFFPIKAEIDSEPLIFNVYRGTLSAMPRGKIGNIYYYSSISVEIIEQ